MNKATQYTKQLFATLATGLKQAGGLVIHRGMSRVFSLPRSAFNFVREVGDGTGSSTVMAPILWVARVFPEAPIKIEQVDREGQTQVIHKHPLKRLLRRPNKFYSGAVMWMATILSFLVDGNAYWLKERNNNGTVIGLWWVPHWIIEPTRQFSATDSAQFVESYTYQPNGAQVLRLDVSEVVHFRFGLDQDDPRKGLSPIKSVLREIFTDDEAANFSASLLRNMGVPGVVISPETDEPVDPEDANATKQYVQDEYKGDNRGKPLVMSGRTKVSQFGFNPQQMNLKDLRRVPEERVTAVLGMPAMVAGLGAGLDRSTFSNYAEAKQAAYESNIIPTQRLFAEEIQHQLLVDFEDDVDDFEISFDNSNVSVLQEDENQRADRWAKLVNAGIALRSEAREAFDLDINPGDDSYLQGISIIERPVGKEPVTAPPSNDDGGNGNGDGSGTNSTNGYHKSLAIPPSKEVSEAAGQRLADQFDRDRQQMEDVWTRELQDEFQDLGKRAAQAYLDSGLDSGQNSAPSTQTKDIENDVETIIRGIGIANWKEEIFVPSFQRQYKRVADQTINSINTVMELGMELPDEVAVRITEQGGRRAGLVDVERDLRRQIFSAIADGRDQGIGPPDIARQIQGMVPAGPYPNAGSRYRANTIARTETKFAQNYSSLESYKATPAVNGVVAYDNRIGHDDADCVERNGQIFSFDEADAEMAEEHPNGTLSFAPATPSQMPQPR